MPTKSKKRRPKKDGRVSYQHVSLAQPNVVLREVDYIVERAARCDPRFVTLGQLLFFSTDTGDAWMLDPEDHLALCLAKAGSGVAVQIVETVTRYAIEWTASYRFEGDAFVVTDESGQRSSSATQYGNWCRPSNAPPDNVRFSRCLPGVPHLCCTFRAGLPDAWISLSQRSMSLGHSAPPGS